MAKKYKVHSKVVPYPGMDAWYFAYVNKKLSEEIKQRHTRVRRGFGSIRVKAVLGKTSWRTSIFPDKQSGTYLLPLKSQVRRDEEIEAGDTVTFTIEI